MSQTPACPDVPDDVRALAMIAVAQLTPHCSDEADMDVIARAILADRASRTLPSTALAARPEEGWQLVPVEPTRQMWAAAGDAIVALQVRNIGYHDALSEAAWNAMLAAAPSKPPTAGDGHD